MRPGKDIQVEVTAANASSVGNFMVTLFVLSMVVLATTINAAEIPTVEINSEETAGRNGTLLDLPEQNLSSLEATVAEQLRHYRDLIDTLKVKGGDNRELADAYGELGKLYHAYELNRAAEICYTNASHLDVNQFQWSYFLAALYLHTGRPKEALEHYHQIASVHPQPALLHIRIGESYQALNRLEEARQSYLQAFYLRPEATVVLARLGELAVEEKQYRTAVAFLSTALARQPEANRLHYPLAMAYRGLDNTELAVKHLQQRGSVGIQPRDPWADGLKELLQGERSHLLRGKLAYSAGRFEESIEAFRTALAFDRDSARAHINLGTALMQTGETGEAIDHHQKALALEPDNLTALYNLGFLYLNTGRHQDAIPHLEKVISANTEDTSAHQLLAQALERSLRIEEAMDYYRKAVIIDPTAGNAWMGGVRLLLQNGEYSKALNVLNQAYENLPNNGLVVHALAKLLAASPDKSIRDGVRALPLALQVFQASPSVGHAQTVAMAYAEAGECSEAAKWQQRAIDTLNAGNEATSATLRAELERYENNQPCG